MKIARTPGALPRRRDLLRLALTTAAFPLLLPASARGANNRLNVGAIGVGRMGRGDLGEALYRGLKHQARVRAVCDVDRHRAREAAAWVDKTYAQERPAGEGGEACAVYGDFRELLARADLDVVTVSTPDHWHGLIALAAARAGKDVYLQKPLTYSLAEGRALIAAVRGGRRVLQTGSQQRSSVHQRRVCQLVRNGRLGRLREIHVTLPPDHGTGRATPMPVPENLDFAFWLGPAPESAYTEDRVHPRQGLGRPGWLQIEAYCRGMVTGWGAHMFDAVNWALGDVPLRFALEAKGSFPDRGLFDVHTTFQAEARLSDGVRLTASTGDPAGVKFVGEAGWASFVRGSFSASDREWLRENPADAVPLPVSVNHMDDFYRAVRSRQDPICPVEVGHRANALCLVVHAALKTGRTLHWDGETERCGEDAGANAWLNPPLRAPWTL
jgi:predicted dehydrogenase